MENERVNYKLCVDDLEHPEPLRSKPYDEEFLLKEIAIHEASHFVFMILAEKVNVGFSRVKSIEVLPETVINGQRRFPKGECHGFVCPLELKIKPYENGDEIDRWYLNDTSKKRIFLSIFSLLAGYTSYKVFFENSEYFVSLADAKRDQNSVPYYKLETLSFTHINDFKKIGKRLELIGKVDDMEKRCMIRELVEDVTLIMKKTAVFTSIKIVASRLLEIKGRKIQGREIEKLRNKISRITKGVSIFPQLSKYGGRFK